MMCRGYLPEYLWKRNPNERHQVITDMMETLGFSIGLQLHVRCQNVSTHDILIVMKRSTQHISLDHYYNTIKCCGHFIHFH